MKASSLPNPAQGPQQAPATGTKPRINELDFLKFVFIMLMITFHLVYIGNSYPYAKQIVYTFHMPAFLVISGYLANISKKPTAFLRTLLWLFIPYAVMECGYTVMASLLPIREHIDHLTASLLIEKILVHPLGPYWYFHTLILCSLIYYGVFRILRTNRLSRFIVIGLLFYLCARELHIVSFACAAYFMAGAMIRQSGAGFLRVVRPSWLSILPVVIMACYPQNLDKGTVAGMVIVYLVMSFCLAVFGLVKGRLRRFSLAIGRNTLILLLFSPIFTLLAKYFLPYLSFDPTGMVFLAVALAFALAGCFAMAYVMDRLGLSRYFFGKPTVLQ